MSTRLRKEMEVEQSRVFEQDVTEIIKSELENVGEVATYATDPFDSILAEMSELHNKKGKDYGGATDPYANVRASQEFGVDPWVGALIRLNDKITRLKSFIRRGELANESALDSIRDVAVYGVIMQVLYREQYPEGQ